MKLAWFRPAPSKTSELVDDVAALIARLGSSCAIETFDQRSAHEFVWMQDRSPFDLCVFELDDTLAHRFVWPYALHYPGVLHLRTASLHESRSAALRHERRTDDYVRELGFSESELIGAPVLASRVVVVSDPYVARRLQAGYPAATIRHAPIGIDSPGMEARAGASTIDRADRAITCGVIGGASYAGMIGRAVHRARDAGANIQILDETSPDIVLARSDVVVAVAWPPSAWIVVSALAAMARRRPVVVFETEATAGWPALDPQTWRPRDVSSLAAPVVVSIDPRDDEHSLMLALKRLAADRMLREDLGNAAHLWWRANATLSDAVTAWNRILSEAALLAPPPRPPHWPKHLSADGSERARAILAEIGTTVDFLP